MNTEAALTVRVSVAASPRMVLPVAVRSTNVTGCVKVTMLLNVTGQVKSAVAVTVSVSAQALPMLMSPFMEIVLANVVVPRKVEVALTVRKSAAASPMTVLPLTF